MRVGIEVQRLFRKKKHGMEVVALELLRQLQAIDHSNEYVVFVKDDVDSDCIKESENLKIVKVPGIAYPDWEQRSLLKAIKKERIDLLHCTCNTAPVQLDVPLLVTIHDVIYLESINFSGTSYQNFGNLYRRFVVPSIARKSEKIITVSNYEKTNLLTKLKVPENKVEVVYNGVNDKFTKIYDQDLLKRIRQKYELPSDFLLFFGNTAPKKNIRGVLKGYSIYLSKHRKNALPLIITDSHPAFINRLLQELELEDIREFLIILDFVPQNELPALYNLAKAFLYLSLRESFGLPILEAMACGTPVITSSVSAMPEVAQDAALLCDPNSPEDISSSIAQLVSDPYQYEQLVQKGLKRVDQFNWGETALKVMDLYNEVLC